MSLQPEPIGPVPDDTMRVAHAAFPKGNPYLRLRDDLGLFYTDEQFADLFPMRGQPAESPWRLALVLVLQFVENLTDRQAADAVRARIDWTYLLGLELTDEGFDDSTLSEFRARLLDGDAAHRLLDALLAHYKERGLLKARGRQRTDATHVLAAMRVLNRVECVGEAMRHALNTRAVAAPMWLRGHAAAAWADRYAHRIEGWGIACRVGRPSARRWPWLSGRMATACSPHSGTRRHPLGCGTLRPCGLCVRFGCTNSIERRAAFTGARTTISRPPSPARRRTHQLALRCRGALRDQAQHDLDRVQGACDRNVRR